MDKVSHCCHDCCILHLLNLLIIFLLYLLLLAILQWWNWRPPKAFAINWGAEKGNRCNQQKGYSILGLWCEMMQLLTVGLHICNYMDNVFFPFLLLWQLVITLFFLCRRRKLLGCGNYLHQKVENNMLEIKRMAMVQKKFDVKHKCLSVNGFWKVCTLFIWSASITGGGLGNRSKWVPFCSLWPLTFCVLYYRILLLNLPKSDDSPAYYSMRTQFLQVLFAGNVCWPNFYEGENIWR